MESRDVVAANTVVCLMGPTASGKTELALALAHSLAAEIVSVDSAMVYRGMDIGTAKPDVATRARCRHHLIDIRDPAEPYSAAAFVLDAERAVADIHARGKLPLLVGGTMLYFKAFKQGLAELPRASTRVRQELKDQMASEGLPALVAELGRVDPQAASRIHANDPQRVLRALEVFRVSGVGLSTWLARGASAPRPVRHRLLEFSLEPERARIHAAIERRFDAMLKQGLLDEVRELLNRGDLTADLPSMRCVGYRQVIEHLSNRYGADEMRSRAIAATRQLAKRQTTWLGQWRDVTRIDPHAIDAASAILKYLRAVPIVGRTSS